MAPIDLPPPPPAIEIVVENRTPASTAPAPAPAPTQQVQTPGMHLPPFRRFVLGEGRPIHTKHHRGKAHASQKNRSNRRKAKKRAR